MCVCVCVCVCPHVYMHVEYSYMSKILFQVGSYCVEKVLFKTNNEKMREMNPQWVSPFKVVERDFMPLRILQGNPNG